MSVYGDFLGAFSELRKRYEVYELHPLVEAGYRIKFWKTVPGVIISATKDRLVYRNGVLHQEITHTLYTKEQLDLRNKVIKYKGKWLRTTADGTWVTEGGFCINQLTVMEGNVSLEEEESTSSQVIEGDF